MNQQKTGEFLKRLRKEKNLTQEQLSEHFFVSSRTVSRWETGRNLPDVGMLIELADFYEVDIREIIDGERKGEKMNIESKETLKKVAEYSDTERKVREAKWALALGLYLFVALLCFMLFTKQYTGLLYGIVPENICRIINIVVIGVAGAVLNVLRLLDRFRVIEKISSLKHHRRNESDRNMPTK